jgi:hypothetical protein
MAIVYLGTVVKRCTRELSEDFATMPKCRSERPFSKDREAYLLAELESGRWHSPRWAIAYFENKRYRVNGQHSSAMLATCNGTFPENSDVLIDEFRVDSELELAALFDRFDRPESSRTFRETINAHKAVEDDLAELSVVMASQLVGAIAFCADPHANHTRAADRAALLHHHKPFMVWAAEFARSRDLNRVPILACVYKSWQVDPVAAKEFWAWVRDGSHPENTHPSRVLQAFLVREGHPRNNPGGGRRDQRWNRLEIHVKCIRAWNAYRTGITTSLLKVLPGDTKDFPKLL